MSSSILIMLLSVFSSCSEMDEIRLSYHNIDSEKKLKEFIKQCKQSDCSNANPYLAVATMQKAEYAFLPTSKLWYFKRGKKQLESFIAEHPGHVEARYLRMLVQSEIPKFLGYHNNIEPDMKYVSEHLDQLELTTKMNSIFNEQINRIKNQK